MQKLTANAPETKSADLVEENLQKLKALFPEAFTEGKVDFEVLRQLLGGTVDTREERYGLNWHGKRQARQIALTPSLGTLRPCPEESVDWDTTQNLMIEGDNLEVLKLLQKSYAGKVKLIYIDPPYNTGRNIIYPNDYSDSIRAYLEITGQTDGGARMTSNPETGGRFHSNWLSMIYPRLKLAKTLLRQDGILFCTIDKNEHATLSLVLAEIFNEGTYEHAHISIVHNPRGIMGTNVSYVHENAIVVYRADRRKYLADVKKPVVDSRNLRDSGTESDRTDARTCFYPFLVRNGQIVGIGDVPTDNFHPVSANVARPDGTVEVWPLTDHGDEKKWRYSRDSVERILAKLEPKAGRTTMQIIFHQDMETMRSVWQNARYDASEYGTKLLDELVPGAAFTFPKSLHAVYDSIRIATEDDPSALILDFFAGSGTTGHAVMQLNADTGGSRRFILVQIPLVLDSKEKEQREALGFCERRGVPSNLAELTKERLRRAAQRVASSSLTFSGDLGFRVFKLAASNIRAWDPNRDKLAESLLEHTEHLVPGRTEQDVLYELLLKLGLDLTVPIVTRTIAGKIAHNIGAGTLIVSLADGITRESVEDFAQGIIAWRKEINPAVRTSFVFKDSGFSDDVVKMNLVETLEQNFGKSAIDIRSI